MLNIQVTGDNVELHNIERLDTTAPEQFPDLEAVKVTQDKPLKPDADKSHQHYHNFRIFLCRVKLCSRSFVPSTRL